MQPGFGLGRLHHVFRKRTRERIVLGAFEARFRHFDVAPVYGDGLNERELGRILGSRREAITIATKFGIPFRAIGQLPVPLYLTLRAAGKALPSMSWGAHYDRRDFGPSELVSSLEASLRRLRTSYVDYLLVHEPVSLDQFRSLDDTWMELERQQRLGKIRRFGVSSDTELLLKAEAENLVPHTAVRMVPMNQTTCSLASAWFQEREVFVFNVVKHLGRRYGPERIETRALFDGFVEALPHCRPIFATHNVDELKRIAEILNKPAAQAAISGEVG